MKKFNIVGGAFKPEEKGKKTEIVLPPEQAGSMENDIEQMTEGMIIVTAPTLPIIAAMVKKAKAEGKTELSPVTKGRDEGR